MASHTVLIAPGPFPGTLDGARVAAAVGRGLRAGGKWEVEICPIAPAGEAQPVGVSTLAGVPILAGVPTLAGDPAPAGDPARVRGLLDALDFDARMRAAHAVVVVEPRLDHAILRGSAAFEIATRARQGGVPAYAITACNELDPFEARILDLQLVLEARTERTLIAAGRRLAKLI